MSFTAGSTFQAPTAGGISGLGGIGAPDIAGQEKPEWDFPQGIEAVDQDVREMFFRGDFGPSGLNEFLQNAPAEAVDRFRAMINGGLIRPKNQSAANIARGYGGLRAGDQTLLGPLIDGMPEGLTPEYWAVVINKAQQAANEQIALMDRTGYFQGMPTMQRQELEAQIADNIARTEISRRLADNTIRQTDLDEAFRRDEMAQQMRQNIIEQFGYDPGPQGAAGAMAGNQNASVAGANGVPAIPGSGGPGAGASGPGQAQAPNMSMKMGEQVGWQYVPGSGWQRTIAGQAQDLSTQQQAFAQQQAQAALASDPRNYIEAQMLGSSRGGLNGFAPNNQVTPTTQTPAQWGAMSAGMAGANLGQDVGQYAAQVAQPAQPGAQAGLPQPGTFQAMPEGGVNPQMQQQRLALLGQLPGQANLSQPGQALNQAGFQAPGVAGQGAQGVLNGQAQPGQIAVGAFSNALNKNRLVPGSGAMQTQGTWSSIADLQRNTNPLKWRTQDYMRGNASERAQANATASLAGYSDEDLQSQLQKNLPTFKAPGAGAMV